MAPAWDVQRLKIHILVSKRYQKIFVSDGDKNCIYQWLVAGSVFDVIWWAFYTLYQTTH